MKIEQKYQGDVSILSGVDKPKVLKLKKLTKELVIAEGEQTGHSHRIVADKEAVINYAEYLNGWYLDIKKGSAKLTHEEHEVYTLTPGRYYFGHQYEYDEIAERRVQD